MFWFVHIVVVFSLKKKKVLSVFTAKHAVNGKQLIKNIDEQKNRYNFVACFLPENLRLLRLRFSSLIHVKSPRGNNNRIFAHIAIVHGQSLSRYRYFFPGTRKDAKSQTGKNVVNLKGRHAEDKRRQMILLVS